ncbi:HlyD family secretion protein [Chromobacterium alticapitis]|uniref:Secretion protein n=1 Tax=Chromobacterium alticapitis TaxID=2073169 RepID=A0A2S5DIZ9_9NEIS|nr:HlyD family efflux transporter periplasmic adaptor subunit [Chromobacterium alticapitis]POZ63075.1 secretion protein [Chromobacterium alticapitis]
MSHNNNKPPLRSTLFRKEVIARLGDRRYGSIILTRNRALSYLTILFCGIAIAILLFFFRASYTEKSQIKGILFPKNGLIRVKSIQDGTISEVRVQEGKQVKAGDVLFVLSNARTSATRNDVEQTITALLLARRDSLVGDQSLLRQQAKQKAESTLRKEMDQRKEVLRIDEQISLQQRRVELSEQAVARTHKLQEAHFISAAALQDKQAELIDQQTKLADLKRSRAAAQSELDTIHADQDELRLQAQRDEAATKRNVDSIEQDLTENEAKRHLLVRAPQDGMISGITAQAGQTVISGQAMANLSPAGSPLEAELYAPSRAAGFVKAGMPVLIRYQAYPYQKFGQFRGTVREISRSALRPDELSATSASQNNEPLYRVRVQLDRQNVTAYGQVQALRAGMALDASVLLETRKLYEWVLEPLYSISGKV